MSTELPAKELIQALRAEFTDANTATSDALKDTIEVRRKALAEGISANEKAIGRLTDRVERLASCEVDQSAKIAELISSLKQVSDQQEKNIRSLVDHETRLNGGVVDGEKVPSIEAMRREQQNIEELLDGTRGGVNFSAIATKFREMETLVGGLKWVGGGTMAGLVTLVSLVLGLNQPKGPSVEVLMLQTKVEALATASADQAKTIQDLRVKLAESRSKP